MENFGSHNSLFVISNLVRTNIRERQQIPLRAVGINMKSFWLQQIVIFSHLLCTKAKRNRKLVLARTRQEIPNAPSYEMDQHCVAVSVHSDGVRPGDSRLAFHYERSDRLARKQYWIR